MITALVILGIIFINYLLYKTKWKRKTYGFVMLSPFCILIVIFLVSLFTLFATPYGGLGQGLGLLAIMLFAVVILVLLPFALPVPLYRFLRNRIHFALCCAPIVLFLIFVLTSQSQLAGFSQEVLITLLQKLP
ncbi:MAG: hypothetical protein KBC63_04600 [Candidatus Levybacteria bacterium]|nr:hypothetical protein [Candidatus Levybacteria bacterium]